MLYIFFCADAVKKKKINETKNNRGKSIPEVTKYNDRNDCKTRSLDVCLHASLPTLFKAVDFENSDEWSYIRFFYFITDTNQGEGVGGRKHQPRREKIIFLAKSN